MSTRLGPVLAALLLLSGCIYAPRGVEGVSGGEGWIALPLRGWLAEGRGQPEAIVACLSADCPHRLTVALITLRGEDARTAEAVLRDPERLAVHLRERDEADKDPRRAGIRSDVRIRSIGSADAPGFAITLSRADGRRPPAHAAAQGRLRGESLEIILAVGDDEAATLAALRQASEARLKR
jgi:hypothetical protein